MNHRICINPNCGKISAESECLDYKHRTGARMCPECHEMTEMIDLKAEYVRQQEEIKRLKDELGESRYRLEQHEKDHQYSTGLAMLEANLRADNEALRVQAAEIAKLKDKLFNVQRALGKAAMEINCAGPLDHRIRVMRRDYEDRMEKQGAEIALLREVILGLMLMADDYTRDRNERLALISIRARHTIKGGE